MSIENGQFIIAGPCAAESREQILTSARFMKERGVPVLRASLWKPRTNPGFDGVGEEGIPWITDAAKLGIAMATEVLLPEQAERVAQSVLVDAKAEELILWIGSRNQNHLNQQGIARAVNDRRVKLMIKNQPWSDISHWEGIVNHVIQAGFPKERVILCHRGFCPNGSPNPLGLRNIPDWEMAARLKEATKLPMIIDPSHIGGTVNNVFATTREALRWNFDGFITEVHPNPTQALTDKNQQLNFEQFDRWLNMVRNTVKI